MEICFWKIGALIALVEGVARTKLRETPDFVDTKRRVKNILEEFGKDGKLINNNYITPIMDKKYMVY
ncbi:hypothetical protein RMONA_08060 [Rickettsia monacensis]|uniref:Uncharacterized protein n=1 Tax=Rickettsia monacensis TaxID=109232 RepID=A0A0B7J1C5_9RICK|nr:hypothetical protein [Rickettsia monacensis]CDI29763.1 hypothetical protein RMONA_5605 [Rickettsia monacensis IrR/Munich]CEO17962.1 hypothetical protein RMONA_08060 [Rickettsia monacensis]